MKSSAQGGSFAPQQDRVATLGFSDDRAAARAARSLVDDVLAATEAGELRDDVLSVVTELVTNAVLHGWPPAELTLRVLDGASAVRVEVSDTSRALPVRGRHDGSSMTGRGLALVEALSDSWGVERLGEGKVVWALVRAGGPRPAAEDIDPDALLAQWTDLDDLDDHAEARFTIHLGDVPTDLLLSAKGHVDNLVREFALAAGGADAGTTAAVPAHLAELIDTVVHRFAEARDSIKRQALAAAHAGEHHLRLELRLPLSAAEAADDYLSALDQADAYCRAARLLTLETPPQHRVFRHWYIGELVAQLRLAATGVEPSPAETFEQRLLREIDSLAAAERTAERTARLQSLSAALTSAGTPEAVTDALLREGVAALNASGGAVLLASGPAELTMPGAYGYTEHVLARLRSEAPDAELPAALALRSGEPVWLESREERDLRFPELAGMEPTTVSMCAMPLEVEGRTLGAVRFSFSEARLFDMDERAFIRAMAAQAAQALDRALLHRRHLDLSERLQRSLLPPGLPSIPGLRVAAVYEPLTVGMEVGGDFYDVWACADGRWAFAIGDASGTGPEAAAISALARHTLRALTRNELCPDAALMELNRALMQARPQGDDERFCTVLLGFLTVNGEGAHVDVATGGHPGPLLARADGRVEEVHLSGSLLGLFQDPVVDRGEFTLSPGDELLLYTDGVTDTRRDSRFFGVEGIMDAVREARAAGAGVAEGVRDAVRRHGAGRSADDIAILSLHFTG